MKQFSIVPFAVAVLVAAGLPTVSFAASEATLKPVHSIQPEYPYEAVKAGASKGMVTARMTLDGAGKVTNVEVVDAVPRRLFDRAVIRALSDWRYAEGSTGRTVEVEIVFKQN